MADAKTAEDGEFFWQKCMVVKIRQTDPDVFDVDPRAEKFLPTKKQALRMNPHTYATRDSEIEQLNYMVEHAVDWRWEIGWSSDARSIRLAREGFVKRGEPVPSHEELFDFFKRESVYLMVKLPAARAIEYRMRFVGNAS